MRARLLIGAAGLAASLIMASMAQAFVVPTVSTTQGSVQAVFGSAVTVFPDGRQSIGDGCGSVPGCTFPRLGVTPGAEVTVSVAAPVDSLSATLAGVALGVRTDDRTFKLTAPADLSLPVPVAVAVRTVTALETDTSVYGVTLVPVLVVEQPTPVAPSPQPTVEPQPSVEPKIADAPASVARTSLRLTGRRLAVTIACPATAKRGCSGTVTVRTAQLRIARTTFKDVRAGSRRIVRAQVSASALRHLRRHRTDTLRVRVGGSAEVKRGLTGLAHARS